MKVADDWRGIAFAAEDLDGLGHRPGGVIVIDGPADHLRSSLNEFDGLGNGLVDIGRGRIGHGLNDDRISASDKDAANFYSWGFAAFK